MTRFRRLALAFAMLAAASASFAQAKDSPVIGVSDASQLINAIAPQDYRSPKGRLQALHRLRGQD